MTVIHHWNIQNLEIGNDNTITSTPIPTKEPTNFDSTPKPVYNISTPAPTMSQPKRFEKIEVPGILEFQKNSERNYKYIFKHPTEILVILDVIIVPRHGYIYMSTLRKEAVEDPHYEINTIWQDSRYSTSQIISHPCKIINKIYVEISGKLHRSRSCVPFTFVDANLGTRSSHAKYLFKNNDEDKGPLSKLMNHDKPSINVFVGDSRYIEIDVISRSAGILKLTTRLSINYTDPTQYYNPTGAAAKGSMAVCSKGIDKYSPYLKYITEYLQRIGVSHYYMGYTGTMRDLKKVKSLLAKEIEDGFITIMLVNMKGAYFVGASSFFVMSCYTHARQTDIFVANFDTDELPLVLDKSFYGENGNKMTLAEFILEKFTNDEMMFASTKLYDGPGVHWNVTTYYEPDTILKSRPQKIWQYSSIILSSRIMTALRNHLPAPPLKYSLHVDFPAMSIPAREGLPSYIKVIAITSAVNALEIHQVSGADLISKSGIQNIDTVAGFPPAETMLVANQQLFNTAHFVSMHRTRESLCYYGEHRCGPMPKTLGFAVIMANYSIDGSWFG